MVLLDQGGCVHEHDVRLALAPPDLRGLVEHVWVQIHPKGTREWRVVPDASPYLIAAVTNGPDGPRVRPVLVGPRSRMADIDVSQRVVTIGIRLRPGSIPALVSAPAVEFVDRTVPLDDAFDANVLRELEVAADAPPARLVSELLRALRRAARVSTPEPIAWTLDRVCCVRGMVEVLGASERTVRDHALQEIGLPPKRALRIMRLHRALMVARKRDRSWAAIAQLAGYADQAHLTRELRALLGETPSAWRTRASAVSFKTANRAIG
jgi:AraC-like DNA-binding protein